MHDHDGVGESHSAQVIVCKRGVAEATAVNERVWWSLQQEGESTGFQPSTPDVTDLRSPKVDPYRVSTSSSRFRRREDTHQQPPSAALMMFYLHVASACFAGGALRAPPVVESWSCAGARRAACAMVASDWTESSAWPSEFSAQRWDDSSFGGGVDEAAPVPEQPRERKPIETTKVGRISGPYKRRNGYHAEVTVQHPKYARRHTHTHTRRSERTGRRGDFFFAAARARARPSYHVCCSLL